MDFYALALLFLTVSTTVGAINFISTILRMRPRECRLTRCRYSCYSTATISGAILFSLPALTADLVFQSWIATGARIFFTSQAAAESYFGSSFSGFSAIPGSM